MALRIAAASCRLAVGASIFATAACGTPGPPGRADPNPPAGVSSEPTPVPAAAGAVPDRLPRRLEVVCGPGEPALSAPVVEITNDGLEIAVTGEPGSMLRFQRNACYNNGDCEAHELAGEREVFSLRIQPGEVAVSCGSPDKLGPPSVAMRVEDPAGRYKPADVDPSVEGCIGDAPLERVRRGADAPPLSQAQALVGNRQPGDIVERSGWPGAQGTVRVVRDGAVIGSLRFVEDEDGGWLLSAWTLCGGLTLGLD